MHAGTPTLPREQLLGCGAADLWWAVGHFAISASTDGPVSHPAAAVELRSATRHRPGLLPAAQSSVGGGTHRTRNSTHRCARGCLEACVPARNLPAAFRLVVREIGRERTSESGYLPCLGPMGATAAQYRFALCD